MKVRLPNSDVKPRWFTSKVNSVYHLLQVCPQIFNVGCLSETWSDCNYSFNPMFGRF